MLKDPFLTWFLWERNLGAWDWRKLQYALSRSAQVVKYATTVCSYRLDPPSLTVQNLKIFHLAFWVVGSSQRYGISPNIPYSQSHCKLSYELIIYICLFHRCLGTTAKKNPINPPCFFETVFKNFVMNFATIICAWTWLKWFHQKANWYPFSWGMNLALVFPLKYFPCIFQWNSFILALIIK